ncbi:hypothetical protein ACFL6C_07070 [Myxococcota bacterium]
MDHIGVLGWGCCWLEPGWLFRDSEWGWVVEPEPDTLTALQRVAVRVAAAIWSGRLDPDIATVLGLA